MSTLFWLLDSLARPRRLLSSSTSIDDIRGTKYHYRFDVDIPSSPVATEDQASICTVRLDSPSSYRSFSLIPYHRKFQLFFLFSLGFLIIGITIARLTENSEHSTSQADRVTYASAEILVAAFVVHAPTLYTLLRPRSDPKPMSRGIPYYISEHLRTAEDGHQTLSTLRQPVESKSQSHNANEQVADSLVDPDQEREPKTTFLDDASAKGILVTTEWFQNREVQE